MAQDVALAQYTPKELKPAPGVPIPRWSVLLAASTTFVMGQPLAPHATLAGVYVPYVRGAGDKTAAPECLCPCACITDSGTPGAGGLIWFSDTAGSGKFVQSIQPYFGGAFPIADIPTTGANGLDTAAVSALGGRLVKAGNVLIF